MNSKHIMAGVAVLAVAIVGAIAYSPNNVPETQATVHAQTDSFVYEDYSEARFNELKGSEAFAVFVHSRSCGTCAKLHQAIKNTADNFDGVSILKMEYDEAPQAFIEEYGVTKYHTFVMFDEEGNHETKLGEGIDEVTNRLHKKAGKEMAEKMMDDGMLTSADGFSYETFSDVRYQDLRGSEPFAIFFHSRTCGTCAKKNKQIMDEADQFEGGVILKLEYDESSAELREEFGVTKWDTFVTFDAAGNPTTMAGGSVEDVRAAIN